VYTCTPDNFCNQIEVSSHNTLQSLNRILRIQINEVRDWLIGFARQEVKRRGGNTWWVLVAGEGPTKTCLPGVERRQWSPNRRQKRERERAARGEGRSKGRVETQSATVLAGRGRPSPWRRLLVFLGVRRGGANPSALWVGQGRKSRKQWMDGE
jgi:hypothetical protein